MVVDVAELRGGNVGFRAIRRLARFGIDSLDDVFGKRERVDLMQIFLDVVPVPAGHTDVNAVECRADSNAVFRPAVVIAVFVHVME